VKEQRRERLLSEMYRVTRMEEDYLNGACGKLDEYSDLITIQSLVEPISDASFCRW
jgi:hypothetical protein